MKYNNKVNLLIFEFIKITYFMWPLVFCFSFKQHCFLRFTCIVVYIFFTRFYLCPIFHWVEHNLFILSLVNKYLVPVISAIKNNDAEKILG